MKKIILILALCATFTFVSCKNTTEETTTDETTVNSTEVTSSTQDVVVDSTSLVTDSVQ